MYQFDTETQVSTRGTDTWQGHVSGHWNIGDNPNGGYLVSIALAALRQQVPLPDPLSITTHYLRPGLADEPCDIQVDVVRTGRTACTARASLSQQGKGRIEVLGVFGDLSQNVGVATELSLPVPAMVAPEQCVQRSGVDQGIHLPILERLDIRLDPQQALAGKNDAAVVSGWIRFLDGRAPSADSLLLFADAFPPSPFALLGVIGWVPTVELTVHVRRRPVPGWIRAQLQTDDLHHGRMIENGALWDSTGALVAQSRQLGLIMGAAG